MVIFVEIVVLMSSNCWLYLDLYETFTSNLIPLNTGEDGKSSTFKHTVELSVSGSRVHTAI